MNVVKTTIEIDEDKLKRLLLLTGLKTRKEVVDWALTEGERIASLNRIAETPWDAAFLKEAIEPDYDIIQLRRQPVDYRDVK